MKTAKMPLEWVIPWLILSFGMSKYRQCNFFLCKSWILFLFLICTDHINIFLLKGMNQMVTSLTVITGNFFFFNGWKILNKMHNLGHNVMILFISPHSWHETYGHPRPVLQHLGELSLQNVWWRFLPASLHLQLHPYSQVSGLWGFQYSASASGHRWRRHH